MRFIAGSKTFLAGEYSVLFGGSGIVLVTEPNFVLTAKRGLTKLSEIPENSPAYRFYVAHKTVFENMQICFYDPHHRQGGWGASSAQYSLIYKLYMQITKQKFDTRAFLGEYQALADANGVRPSGADCLAQYANHHIYYDSSTYKYEPINWVFPNLDLIILKTKVKISTHEHLKNLSLEKSADVDCLSAIANKIRKNFDNVDEAAFSKNLQEFFEELNTKNLVMPQTYALVNQILQLKHVKAAKGCGALAADTILVVIEQGFREEIYAAVSDIIKFRFREKTIVGGKTYFGAVSENSPGFGEKMTTELKYP